ncbi:uncharacterized protein ACWYII_029547 isoform 2-T9 [Salvelinus alpinus]
MDTGCEESRWLTDSQQHPVACPSLWLFPFLLVFPVLLLAWLGSSPASCSGVFGITPCPGTHTAAMPVGMKCACGRERGRVRGGGVKEMGGCGGYDKQPSFSQQTNWTALLYATGDSHPTPSIQTPVIDCENLWDQLLSCAVMETPWLRPLAGREVTEL